MTIILKRAGCEDAGLIWKMQVQIPLSQLTKNELNSYVYKEFSSFCFYIAEN